MKVRYRERALADLEEISAYISERSPIGAINVLAAIHAAVSELTSNPLASRHTSDPEVRVKVVRRYLSRFSMPSARMRLKYCMCDMVRDVHGLPNDLKLFDSL